MAKGVNNYALKAAAYANWASHVDVLKYVTEKAEAMQSQKSIAAALGKPIRTFEEALAKEKGENPLRLAFEAGRAKAEQKHIDACQLLSPGNPKQMIAWIFYMKAQFGWRDKPDNAITDAPKITFVMPGGYSEAEYLKKLGIEAPIDTRPVEQRVRVGGMKDVTPGADGKLPTKLEGGSHKLTAEAIEATKALPPVSAEAIAAHRLMAPPEGAGPQSAPQVFKPKLD